MSTSPPTESDLQFAETLAVRMDQQANLRPGLAPDPAVAKTLLQAGATQIRRLVGLLRAERAALAARAAAPPPDDGPGAGQPADAIEHPARPRHPDR